MSGGVPKERFFNLEDDYFDCVICQQVVINPKMCGLCNNVFCKSCINEWQKKKPNCPFKCNSNGPVQIGDLPASIMNLYNDLDVKCSRDECDEVVKLKDLMTHEMNCGISKCFNNEKCGNTAPFTIKDKPVCSETCYIIQVLTENPYQPEKELLSHLEKFVEKVKTNTDQTVSLKLSWMTTAQSLTITDGGSVNNMEEAGLYQSAVTDQGYVGGIHYFEVEVHSGNRFPCKIGVTLSKDFDMTYSSFSDMPFGYAFFQKGQLRNNNDSMGKKYGKEVKGKTTLIGVIVNLSKGCIGFTIDGEYQGVAFEAPALFKGPIYPAIALRGGSKAILHTGKELPNEAFFMEV